ncbi:MAG: methyltransferase domain-containing protein [Acidobacteriota bacterium]
MRPFSSPYRYFSGARPWERVLDVGCGNNPHPRADVVVDSDLSDEHRWGSLRGRHLVLADIHHLPFREDAFAVVLCAHVLEHCSDPKAAAAELSRVGHRGIIEVPTPYLDLLLQPFDRHGWLFTSYEGRLLFTRNTQPTQLVEPAPSTLALLDSNAPFRAAYVADEGIFRLQLRWKGRLPISDVPREAFLHSVVPTEMSWWRLLWRSSLLRVLRATDSLGGLLRTRRGIRPVS